MKICFNVLVLAFRLLALAPTLTFSMNCQEVADKLNTLHVSAEQVLSIVPPSEAPLIKIIDDTKAQVESLKSTGADKEEIIALSDNLVERFDANLRQHGVKTEIVEVPMEGGLKRKVIQIVGGEGTVGRIGGKMNESSPSPYNNQRLIYDPYRLFNVKDALAFFSRGGAGEAPGIRVSHDTAVNPRGIAQEALNHEVGHMVEEIMRLKGLDNGLVGFVLPANSSKPLAIEHFEKGMALGENRQYLTSVNAAYKEMLKLEDSLRDRTLTGAAREDAQVAATRARALSQRRSEHLQKSLNFSKEVYNRAARTVRNASDKEMLKWVSPDYPLPMKDHVPVVIPIKNEEGAVVEYLVSFTPAATKDDPWAVRSALYRSLTKTADKLVGIQKTATALAPKITRELDFSPGNRQLQLHASEWRPFVGENITVKMYAWSAKATVESFSDSHVAIQWTSPSGKVLRGKISRSTGVFEPILSAP